MWGGARLDAWDPARSAQAAEEMPHKRAGAWHAWAPSAPRLRLNHCAVPLRIACDGPSCGRGSGDREHRMSTRSSKLSSAQLSWPGVARQPTSTACLSGPSAGQVARQALCQLLGPSSRPGHPGLGSPTKTAGVFLPPPQPQHRRGLSSRRGHPHESQSMSVSGIRPWRQPAVFGVVL